MNSGSLSLVATPIGNLGDITVRAKETLIQADLIYAEDTRVAQRLLTALGIDTSTKSYHQHSGQGRAAEVLAALESGKNIAFISDAGTPGISDPGGELVEYIAKQNPNILITCAPGVSAVAAALSISGFPADKFLFLGFPPHKKKRNQFFEEVAASRYTVVFYESPHRIDKALVSLRAVLQREREVCVFRELTKKFESVYRGTIAEIADMQIPAKGEFVVAVRA